MSVSIMYFNCKAILTTDTDNRCQFKAAELLMGSVSHHFLIALGADTHTHNTHTSDATHTNVQTHKHIRHTSFMDNKLIF